MSETYVEPPALNEWWAGEAVSPRILDRLRLSGADIDNDRIESLVPVAGQLVNAYVDSIDNVVVSDTLVAALEQIVINLYLDPNRDVLEGAREMIRPSKERWGIG